MIIKTNGKKQVRKKLLFVFVFPRKKRFEYNVVVNQYRL